MRGVYVTVRVTISRTWRMLGRPVFGDFRSKYLGLFFRFQSKGERALRALKGERMADVALRGDSAVENAGDWGIRSRLRRAVEGADDGYTKWPG